MPLSFIQPYRMQLRFCLRVTVAALSALAFGRLLGLPIILWAVLTAVILTQMSIGKSVKATIDYSLGTLGGAIYAGLIAAFVPHSSDAAFAVVLAIAVAPLALLAAMSPNSPRLRPPPRSSFWPPLSRMGRLSRRPRIASSRSRWEARSPCWSLFWCFRRAPASW